MEARASTPWPATAWTGWIRRWPGDLALALVVGILQVGGTYLASRRQPEARAFDALGFALLAAGPAALLVRRRYPVTVLGVALAATIAYIVLGYGFGPLILAVIVALYTAVVTGHRAAAWVVVGAVLVHALAQFGFGDNSIVPVIVIPSWMVLVIVVGEVVRVRRSYLAAVEARAIEAEHTREEEARRRASEERLRIARELHDVLAHNVSLINVQAGVALHLIDQHPEQARGALGAIKDASKDTLREIRSVLGMLRGVDETPPLAPSPRLAHVDDLVARAADAGLDVTLERKGDVRDLPTGVDVAAFRIVQEALTNVARHAGPAHATVQVTFGDDSLEVEVGDDGVGSASSAVEGNGIAGMRERVVAVGGDFHAGGRPEGGFRVYARFPLEEDA